MNAPIIPTVETPVVNTLPPSRKGRGKNGNGAINPATPDKAELLAQFDAAWKAWIAGKAGVENAKETLATRQSGLVGITARMAASGHFKNDELITLVKTYTERAGMTPQSASHALIACGLRQRAKRNDAGKTKGPKNPPANPPTNPPVETTPANPVPAVSMTATPAASAPSLPSTPAELAKALVAKLGKEGAIAFIKSAYTEASLG